MHWTVAAPFIHDLTASNADWLIPYIPSGRHQFTVIPRSQALGNWHNQKSSLTGFKEWKIYWQHGVEAVKATKGGVVTVFPQLASTVGFQQRLRRKKFPVVAWLFNVGTCSSGMRRWLARLSVWDIDRFVVHTRRECKMYSQWLGLPEERFEFIPYQVPEMPVTYEENTTRPFIAAVGSAHRDFPVLFKAVEELNLPTVVASGPRALAGLSIPSQVETPMGIGRPECLRLAQEARINVVPLWPNQLATAAGQVTIVEAMRMGRALIATRCLGAEDYIIHGETGLLVEPGSIDGMKQAIKLLWNDEDLRKRLGAAAKQYAIENFSDEAAGAALGRVLNSVEDESMSDLRQVEMLKEKSWSL